MHFSDLTGPLKYKLTNDYMFKAFLQRNEKALRGLLCALLRFKSEKFPEELYLDYFFVNRKTNHIYSDKVSIRMLQLNLLGNEEDAATYRGYSDGIKEGREEGNKQGIDKMSKLITILLGEKKYDELEKASNDDAYRNVLFSRYNI